MPPVSCLLVATLALSLAAPALAEGGITLAVASSSIGVEPVAGVQLSPHVGAHGDAALLGVSRHLLPSARAEDADYLKLRTASAMIDLMPFGHGLRVSAGARYEGEQAPFGFGPGVGRARVAPGWTHVGPVVTLGWTRRFARGLIAVVEAGTTIRRFAALGPAVLRATPIAQAQIGWRF